MNSNESKPKIYNGKDGKYVIFQKINSMWHVTLHNGAGDTIDKVRCDEYRMAVEYRSSFIRIAKT